MLNKKMRVLGCLIITLDGSCLDLPRATASVRQYLGDYMPSKAVDTTSYIKQYPSFNN